MLPRAYTAGLFNDAYPLSTSLWQPATTLPCILVLLGLALGAVALRKRHPALALAVLFFLAAHLMESSVIALELYYEHRNYIPAMLLFWPLALWLCGGFVVNASGEANPPGSLRSVLINGVPVSAKGRYILAPGDRLTTLEAGGGGIGDPRLRDPQALQDDLAQGFVTEEGVRRDYGG